MFKSDLTIDSREAMALFAALLSAIGVLLYWLFYSTLADVYYIYTAETIYHFICIPVLTLSLSYFLASHFLRIRLPRAACTLIRFISYASLLVYTVSLIILCTQGYTIGYLTKYYLYSLIFFISKFVYLVGFCIGITRPDARLRM